MATPDSTAAGTAESHGLSDRLATLDCQIQRLRAEAAAGKAFDLTPLQTRVADLCAAVERLPLDEARRLRVSLLALLADLDLLADQLKAHLDQLRAEVGATGERRRAARAYAGSKRP